MKHPTDRPAPLRKPKARRLTILALCILAAGVACLFIGGSRPHDSVLGIALVAAGILALAVGPVLLVAARSTD